MSHIFISYSRSDIVFAGKIVQALADNNLDTWIDWKSIPKGEDWEQEIYRGIEEADAFLFLVSPDSVASQMCNKEIEHAVKNGKRILPIMIRDTDFKIIHPEISKRNWIFCRDAQDDFTKAIEETRETIHTDYEWLKYHTELQVKALKWQQKKDASRLLRGKELQEAEELLTKVDDQKEPHTTKLQKEYVLASRRSEERQQRQITIILGVGLFLITILGVFAWAQRNTAVTESHTRATAQAETLAGNLAAQAQLVMNKEEDANAPLIAALLAIESIQRYPNAEADETLRNGIGLLAPVYKNIPTTHTEAISKIVFSPNGKLVASSDFDGYIKIWSIDTSEELNSLKVDGRVSTMKFSLDGKSLLIGNDFGDITSLDVAKGSIATFDNHGEGYVNLDISPDGNMMITSGADGIINMWSLETRELVFVLDQGSSIQDLKFTPDGTKIISSGEDNTIKVWDAHTGSEEFLRVTNYFSAYSIGISPDSKKAISGSDEGVEIWDTSSGKTINVLSDSNYTGDDTGFFSPNGKLVATYRSFNNGHVIIWDSESGEKISVINLDFYISGMAFSYDSKHIMTSSEDGSTRLWDVKTGREISRMLQNGRIYSFRLSPTGEVLASAGIDKIIYFWAIPNIDNPLIEPNTQVKDNFVLDNSGNWIATWEQSSNNLEILQVSTNTVISSIPTTGSIVTADISPNGKFLVVADEGNILCVWEIISEKKIVCRQSAEDASLLRFSHNSIWVASREGRTTIKIWEAQTGNVVGNVTSDFFANTFVFSPNDQLIAVGAGGDYKIDLWNVLDQQKIAEFQHDPNVLIGDLVFSEDGKWLISSSRDGTARVWDIEGKDEVSRLTYDLQRYVNMHEVLKTRISPDGSKLLSVNTVAVFNINNDAVTARESTIRVWDPLSGKEINRFIHNSWVNDIIWSPDGKYVFSGGSDGVVRMWDVYNGNEIGRIVHKTEIESLIFTPDGSQIISISNDGEYKLSYWKPEDVINLACKRLTRNLSRSEWVKFFGNIEYHATCPNFPIPTE